MDTTRVEFVGKQIGRVVESVTTHPAGLTPVEVTLIATATGFIGAIVPQLIAFYLNKSKERNNQIKELIADERRIAKLLVAYYRELVMHKVHKQYWYRTSEIRTYDSEDEKRDSHERHFESNKESFQTITKIHEVTSDYFKTIIHYLVLTKENIKIDKLLEGIDSFKPRKASDFIEVVTYNELLKAQIIEEESLNEVYKYYSDCCDKIHEEMINNL